MCQRNIHWGRPAALLAVILFGSASRASIAAEPTDSSAELKFKDAAETLEEPIEIIGYETAEIVSRIEGYVEHVLVDIGDEVQKGHVLARLNVPEISAEVQRQVKLMAKAKADLVGQEAQIIAAESKLAALEATRRLRQSEMDRVESLVGEGALKVEKLDEARYALEVVIANMRSLEAEVAAAEAQLEGGKAAVEVSQAEHAKALAMASYLELRAPFDGEIMQRMVDPGDFVRPPSGDSKPLFELTSTHVLRGVAFIPTRFANKITKGQPVLIGGIGGLQGETFEATVSRYARSLSKARTMRVEIDLKNPIDPDMKHRKLKPGDYGKAVIRLSNETK